MRITHTLCITLVSFVLALTQPLRCLAQAVQAVRGSTASTQIETQMNSIILSVHEQSKNLETLREKVKADTTSVASITIIHLINKAILKGREVLTSILDRQQFQIKIENFNLAVKDLKEILSNLTENDYRKMGIPDVRKQEMGEIPKSW